MDRIIRSSPGTLNFRVLASYIDKLIFDDGLTALDFAGDVGTGGSSPHWRGIASATYSDDRFSTDLRARYVGGGNVNSQPNQQTSCDPIGRTVLCPDIKARVYVDLSARLAVPVANDDGERLTIFGGVANLFDADPPIPANASLYDLVGRYFTFGARINF